MKKQLKKILGDVVSEMIAVNESKKKENSDYKRGQIDAALFIYNWIYEHLIFIIDPGSKHKENKVKVDINGNIKYFDDCPNKK